MEAWIGAITVAIVVLTVASLVLKLRQARRAAIYWHGKATGQPARFETQESVPVAAPPVEPWQQLGSYTVDPNGFLEWSDGRITKPDGTDLTPLERRYAGLE